MSQIAMFRQLTLTTLGSILATAGLLHSFSAGDFLVHSFLHPRMGTSLGSNHLETNGIAKADRVIGCRSRQTEVAMKIELLMRRNLVCRAEINHVLRTTALGKGAGIFDVGVPTLHELPVKIYARLARQISVWSLGWPHNGEHSRNCPVLC